jgi:PAT family beta-lactamase induction signal transducer AmpG
MEAPLFMQGGVDTGGLGLCATDAVSQACPHNLSDKATIDGLVSTIISLVFGIAGGAYASKVGLKTKTLLIMAFCMNVPNLTFVYLSQVVTPEAPVSLGTITALVTIEKAGYSFGFVANMLYMMQQISPGKYHMTHYAFCTALMNLVLIPTQAASGPLAELLGYQMFFIFVCVATIPSFIAAAFAPFPNKPTSQEREDGVGSGASEPA